MTTQKFEITYTSEAEGVEITKEIEANSIEQACAMAADSIYWPLEINNYRTMTAQVRGERGRVDLTTQDLYS